MYVDKPKTLGPSHQLRNVVALDPGSRVFQTTYDPSGRVMKLGTHAKDRIKELCKTVDRRVARVDAYKAAQKQRKETALPPEQNQLMKMRCRNAIRRTRYLQHAASRKIHNTVAHLHWDTINVLFGEYDTVMIPEFKTSSMLPNLH
eukprot:3937167-Rhodomonas_salina.1